MYSQTLKKFVEFFSEYTRNFSTMGIARLVIDILCILAIIMIFVYLFLKRTNLKVLLSVIITISVLYLIAVLIDLYLLQKIIIYLVIGVIGITIILYTPELKDILTHKNRIKNDKTFLTTEETKEQLINTLVTTVNYLSRRSIGALITIEKEHTLNSYIDKAIKLDSIITFELLTTIFVPGTALHDGAVIIRGNHLMCAGAFFPSSDKVDIPKKLGSRHRAAIGISEVSDAFTIVVSEETGSISTTIDGTITTDMSLESLRSSLVQNIIVR